MRYQLQNVSVLPPAIIVGVVVAVLALVPTTIGFVAQLQYATQEQFLRAVLLFVIPPVVGGVALLLTAGVVALYNLAAVRFGGIELELEFVSEDQSTHSEQS